MSRHSILPGCRRLLSATVLAAALPAPPSGAATYYVGPGGDCEASTVEAALALAAASSAADEIRIVDTQTFNLSAPLHLTDWGPADNGALTLSGGWSSCSDVTQSVNRSVLSWSGPGEVIEIDTTGANTSQVTLSHLTLRDSQGRGLRAQGASTVDLLRVLLIFNDGGGLFVDGGADVYMDHASSILDNGPALQGGGIRCIGAGSVVFLEGTVSLNDSAGNGGGIHADLDCEVVLESGAYLDSNRALGGDGGAIHATGGALVSLFPGVQLFDNEAVSRGGGISASGAGTDVLLAGADINGNQAGIAAGGIYATNGASISAGGGSCVGGFCPTWIRQNRLLAGGRNGSAAMAFDDGLITLRQTKVSLNEVLDAEPFGSIFYAETGGEIRTESVAVYNNSGADRVFSVASGIVRVAFTTVANNRYYNASNFLVEALALRAIGAGGEARIFSSIFHPTGGYSVENQVIEQIDCLITENRTGLPTSATEVYVVDPGYLDVNASDYRVGPMSPAVDFCDTLYFTPTIAGLDARARSHNLPANPEGMPGPFGSGSIQDAGAFEAWELFADGFETGNTSRWSTDAP